VRSPTLSSSLEVTAPARGTHLRMVEDTGWGMKGLRAALPRRTGGTGG